jgi:hypothetical protein
MNLDDLEKAVLSAARHELTPTERSALCARDAVLARIARTAAPSEAGPAGSGVGPTHVGLGALAKAKAVSLVTMGCLGFASGWASHAILRSTASKPTLEVAPPKTAALTPSPRVAPAPVRAVEAARTVETPAVKAPVAGPASPPPEPSEQDGAATPARLREEVELLRVVDRALRANDPATAQRVLDELERRLPDGKLGEEREAARVLVACMRNQTEATRAMAQSFLARHRATVYSGRIRETCGLGDGSG